MEQFQHVIPFFQESYFFSFLFFFFFFSREPEGNFHLKSDIDDRYFDFVRDIRMQTPSRNEP